MLFVDYSFEVAPNMFRFDKEIKFKDLEGWKDGDIFKVMTDANGHVILLKVKSA